MSEKDDRPDIVDFNKRKLAMDLQKELGGVFGIDIQDIEKALERLQEGKIQAGYENQTNLPDTVQSVIRFLEGAVSMASFVAEQGDISSLRMIQELFEHYKKQVMDITPADND